MARRRPGTLARQTTSLDRLSGGTDVELELQRMKAELAGGSPQQAIEGGTGQGQSQQQPQDTPRFYKQ